MRIVQLAPLWKSIPPLKYGGTELIVSLLTEELTKQGHQVTLISCGGSKTTGNLIEIIPEPLFEQIGKFDFGSVQFPEMIAIHEALKMAESGEADIIHNHMGFHAAVFASFSRVPWVTTIHSSLPPDYAPLALAAQAENFVSISQAQRANAPYLNYIDNVYHGIDVAKFEPNYETNDNYLAYFATMREEKGADRAIQIALESNYDLIMAGDIREREDYKRLEPYIDGKKIRYIGELNFEQKNELLKSAKAYLFPIRWNEAFGLSVVESLACGTPVVAWPNGSLPELITDGYNGFLVNSIQEAVSALDNIGEISRRDCRKLAEEKFDIGTMVERYIRVYQRLAG